MGEIRVNSVWAVMGFFLIGFLCSHHHFSESSNGLFKDPPKF